VNFVVNWAKIPANRADTQVCPYSPCQRRKIFLYFPLMRPQDPQTRPTLDPLTQVPGHVAFGGQKMGDRKGRPYIVWRLRHWGALRFGYVGATFTVALVQRWLPCCLPRCSPCNATPHIVRVVGKYGK
jgi:hypothetical protein